MTFLVVRRRGGYWPLWAEVKDVLNTLQGTEYPSTTKDFLVSNISRAAVEKTVPAKHLCSL